MEFLGKKTKTKQTQVKQLLEFPMSTTGFKRLSSGTISGACTATGFKSQPVS